MKVEVGMKHQVSLPTTILPSPAKHNLLFSKNLTLAPKGSFSNKGLQGTPSGLKQSIDGGSSHWLSCMKACLPVSHRNPGLLELFTWEQGQRDWPERDQQWSQPPIQFFPNSPAEEAAWQFLPIPMPTCQLQLPCLAALRMYFHVLPPILLYSVISTCSQTICKNNSNY